MLRHNKVEVPTANSGSAKAAAPLGASPLDALPKQFVASMKTLFDILDDHQSGYVKFSDIEKGWQDDGCKGLPKGVIDSLRKVTPASGLLSFERFCAGLKLCLLRNQASNSTNACQPVDLAGSPSKVKSSPSPATPYHKAKSPLKQPRPPSAPLLEIENPLPSAPWKPPTVLRSRTQRACSMPQLSPDSDLEVSRSPSYNVDQPPPKPPRASAIAANGGAYPIASAVSPPAAQSLDKAQIRHALQNWQMKSLLSEMDSKDPVRHHMQHPIPPYRGCADGSSSSATDSAVSAILGGPVKKSASNKRREPRRHTLQNGIDYNMLKRSKQYEEERQMLLIGLDAVDKARNWYLRQLANVDERIKYLRMGTHEQWSEVQQERLNFQRARVLEVNRNLAVLTDTWERGDFPTHFNLAIRSGSKAPPNTGRTPASTTTSSDVIATLPRTRAAFNPSNERLTLLERENQALLHELYKMQQRHSVGGGSGRFVNVLSQPSPVCSSSSGGLGDADVVY